MSTDEEAKNNIIDGLSSPKKRSSPREPSQRQASKKAKDAMLQQKYNPSSHNGIDDDNVSTNANNSNVICASKNGDEIEKKANTVLPKSTTIRRWFQMQPSPKPQKQSNSVAILTALLDKEKSESRKLLMLLEDDMQMSEADEALLNSSLRYDDNGDGKSLIGERCFERSTGQLFVIKDVCKRIKCTIQSCKDSLQVKEVFQEELVVESDYRFEEYLQRYLNDPNNQADATELNVGELIALHEPRMMALLDGTASTSRSEQFAQGDSKVRAALQQSVRSGLIPMACFDALLEEVLLRWLPLHSHHFLRGNPTKKNHREPIEMSSSKGNLLRQFAMGVLIPDLVAHHLMRTHKDLHTLHEAVEMLESQEACLTAPQDIGLYWAAGKQLATWRQNQ